MRTIRPTSSYDLACLFACEKHLRLARDCAKLANAPRLTLAIRHAINPPAAPSATNPLALAAPA